MTSILIPVACLALVGAFLAAIVHPILTRKDVWQRATGTRRQRLELTERKEQVYASIKEMEFDHSLGKMSQVDYEDVRGGLEAEAVEILRRMDRLGNDSDSALAPAADLEARIERDIAAQRRAVASVGAAPAAPLTATPLTATPLTAAPSAAGPVSSKTHAFCHNCGEARTSEHRFCPHCGQSFIDAVS